MSNIIVFNKSFSDDNALENVINYVISGTENGEIDYMDNNEFVCHGVNPLSVQTIINSFNLDKRFYNKTSGKQVHHFILSIYKKNYSGIQNNKEWASLLMNELSYYLREEGFKNIACVHVAYGDNVHIHFAVNSVNSFTGKKLINEKIFYGDILTYLRRNFKILNWESTIFKNF